MGGHDVIGEGPAAGARTVSPYGSWRSPITAHLIAETGIGLGWLQAAGDALFWVELRPLEGGRYVVVRRAPDGTVADVTPPGRNSRTLVHEYGGGMYAVHAAAERSTVVWSEFADQRLYRVDVRADGSASEPQAITSEPPAPRALRYADGRFTPDGRTLVCVRERHDGDAVVNELVAVTLPEAVDAGPAEPVVLASGHDFYAAPRLSPDGRRLAWLCWDHPQMPWDGTELWVGELAAAGGLAAQRRVAGGPAESVVQPGWSPDGRLHFISDRSGWWNLYRNDEGAGATEPGSGGAANPANAQALAPLAAEFAKPAWVFGQQGYGFLPDGRIAVCYSQDGAGRLGVIDPSAGASAGAAIEPLACALTSISWLAVSDGRLALIGGGPTRAPAVAILDTGGALEEVRRSKSVTIDAGYLSAPEPVAFPTSYEPGSAGGPLLGELAAAGETGITAHALYYPPANRDFAAPPGAKPPLVVMSHGGPTAAAEALLSFDVQYWTSRGVAVVDVNYGGSTGYGRAYRERLRGNWGIVDTVDCINAARYLAERGDVDPARIAVQGGSAGGYTTLNALTRHRFFAAGASYFGLADLEAFVSGGTHKFESQYLLGLVGPYPELAEVYRERSPINHVGDIACPVIVLQGLEDEIVPPVQAEVIVAALRAKGLPYAYLPFPGEQHGFRKAENIVRAKEAELYFYGRVFGFTPADEIEPVAMENLD